MSSSLPLPRASLPLSPRFGLGELQRWGKSICVLMDQAAEAAAAVSWVPELIYGRVLDKWHAVDCLNVYAFCSEI